MIILGNQTESSETTKILSYLPVSMLSFMTTYSKFHKCFSMRMFSCNIKINRWCIAVSKNIIKFKLLRIAKGMFPVANIFLLHVTYKMHYLRII